MKISFDSRTARADMTAVFAAEGGKLTPAGLAADKKSGGALKRAVASEKFEGKKGQTLVVTGGTGGRVVIVGLGKTATLTLADFEKAGSALVPLLNGRKAASVEIAFDAALPKSLPTEAAAAQMALGMMLNSYRFDKHKTRETKDKKPTLASARFTLGAAARAKKLFAAHRAVADGVFFARDLTSELPNFLYPGSFAAIAKKRLAPLGITVKILEPKEIQKLGMGALYAVGQGSPRGSRLVTLHYKGGKKNQKPVAFVGKGVTYDSGGLNIKTSGMADMKWDMAGAGAVAGLMLTLASRKAKVNAVGVLSLAENMVDGAAVRPADVITTMSGQTVEILNTDAEGRLVLCDALWYCQEKFGPDRVVDIATLTGAMIMALGHEFGGLFSNDDKLSDDLVHAGKDSGERLWRMPLDEAWDKDMDSTVADIRNFTMTRDGDSAHGAHFIQRFVQKGVKWAHLDIAGMAWANKDKTSTPKGATAFGVRLLDRFVADYCEK